MQHPVPAFAESGTFRDIFFEEAQEHLANTEAILLRLDTQEPSSDDLNAIFRAVHSIKGSAAMLGFQEIAALAHVFENLLDLLRKGERPLAKADVDAMLEAGDVAKAQVAHRRGLLDETPDRAAAEALLRERVAVEGDARGWTAHPPLQCPAGATRQSDRSTRSRDDARRAGGHGRGGKSGGREQRRRPGVFRCDA